MKKLLIWLLVVIFVVLVSPIPALAQSAINVTPEDNGAALDAYTQNGTVNSNVHVFNVKDADAFWLICRSVGVGCTNIESQKIPYLRNSAMGTIASGITTLYLNKPADTQQFIAYYSQRLGFPAKSAYAQGIGFSGLSPILGLWRAFRNIAYGFLIIIMVAIGFMILFRMKIDPRTVISVQNAIPRVIVTLLLITFSYAIVGLLIDVMYLVLFLVIAAVNTSQPFQQLPNVIAQYSGGPIANWWAANFTFGKAGVEGIVNLVGGANFTYISTLVLTIIGAVAGLAAIGPWGLAIGGGIGALAGGTNALIWLIVSLALLFAFFRIFFMLISAYIQIIISVIFGPLQLMMGAIPNLDAFGSWIRGLVANLAIFPITSVMLLIGHLITVSAVKNQNLWTPPGLGGNVGAAATGIISFGIVLLIPTLANSFKELIKAKPVLPVGAALSQSLTSPWGTAMQLLSTGYYLQSITAGMFRPKPPTGAGEPAK